MKEEIARKWIAELRSGKHKQGRKRLRNEDGSMCCLGGLQGPVLRLPITVDQLDLSEAATEAAGTRVTSPRAQIGCAEEVFPTPLSNLNDGAASLRRHTFAEIADIIEQHWQEL